MGGIYSVSMHHEGQTKREKFIEKIIKIGIVACLLLIVAIGYCYYLVLFK